MDSETGVRSFGYQPVKPLAHTPTIKRKKRPKRREWVFLSEDLWDALDLAAAFQSKIFELEGAPEEISRNAWMEDALTWALTAYWSDKGGEPESKEEVEAMAQLYFDKKAESRASLGELAKTRDEQRDGEEKRTKK